MRIRRIHLRPRVRLVANTPKAPTDTFFRMDVGYDNAYSYVSLTTIITRIMH